MLRLIFEETAADDCVLSLGGGTPTYPESKEMIRGHIRESSGKVALVYLRATPATLASRLSATDLSSRPSLTGRGVIEEIGELFDKRDPLYTSLATRVIDVDNLTPQQTAAMLSG
jgi:shikimate kinase